jgi:hypothetical protein
MKSTALLLLLTIVAMCVAEQPTPTPPRYTLRLLGGQGGALLRQSGQTERVHLKTVEEFKRAVERMPSGSTISFNWYSDMKLESEFGRAYKELKIYCERKGITLSFMAAPFI